MTEDDPVGGDVDREMAEAQVLVEQLTVNEKASSKGKMMESTPLTDVLPTKPFSA